MSDKRTFDPDRHCGAQTNPDFNDARPCRQMKGHRTDHVGAGHCWLHTGRSRNGERHAMREQARNALATLKIDGAVDPVTSLYEAVAVAAWREYGLRMMLEQRDALFGADHLGDQREDVVSQMHADALKTRAQVAKMAVDAGLDERMVRLAERQADVLVRLVDVVLEAAGVEGDPAERARAAASTFLAETSELDTRQLVGSRN